MKPVSPMAARAKTCLRAVAGLLAIFLLLAGGARAAEQIRNFHSDITVARNGVLTVTETLSVNVENIDINHGIFRDFPLTFRKPDGSIGHVDFKVLDVERDGRPEAYHTETIDNGIRIYIGSADGVLTRNIHTFKLTYETGRQIRYLDDADQLYWNITGNFWKFPILTSDADISLPDNVRPMDVRVYTGKAGATGADATTHFEGSTVYVTASRPFRPGEGMTVQVDMPLGSVDRPSQMQELLWWMKDNRNLLISGVGMIAVWLWYGWSWVRVGRDPPQPVMVPRWDVPEGVSPALVNYIDNKGFSGGGWTAFSAAALSLAVKGLVTLDDLKNSITIKTTGKSPDAKLPAGEASLFSRVSDRGGEFRIDEANGEAVKSAGSAFVSAIEKEHRNRYYHHNTGYVVAGVVLSVLVVVALVVFGNLEGDAGFMVIAPTVVGTVVSVFVGNFGRGLRRGASLASKILSVIVLGFVGIIGFTVLAGILAVAIDGMVSTGQMPVLVAIFGIVVANILFFFIMGAPTPLGSKLMTDIDGLRQYLTLAERDRMNLRGAPEMSPTHFETLLPFAVALGVEKPWAKTFETWLATANLAETYQPVWYHGTNIGSFSESVGGFSHSMASTIESTLPAPPPSSSSSSGGGGGGGFSGGGGGGGGGGGW